MANVNDMTFNQLAATLNTIVNQATGAVNITPTNTGEFVSVGQTALKTGYDPLMTAISQVLSRTIFSIRPYTAKFRGMQWDEMRWGNHVRKLSPVDKPFEDDQRLRLEQDGSIDQYKVNKPEVLQMNFYGANIYQKRLTIYRDQLDSAFRGVDQFNEFITMIMSNASDQLEQARENTARATLANFIMGKSAGDSGNVIHLVSEYNDVTGLNLDGATVKKPENFVPFTKWMFARIKSVAQSMSERSQNYHINVTDKPVSRHTPANRLKMYMFAPLLNEIESSVLSSVYNDRFLRMADHESVTFWQSIDSPDGVQGKPTYLLPTGLLQTAAETVSVPDIVGVMFDEEAVGINLVNQWSAPTPFNAAGGYSNMYWHETHRYINDFTENGVVLVLD